MKRIFIISFVFFAGFARAQMLTPAVIASAGGTASVNSNFFLDYTVGECVITTAANSGTILTQGFQQPFNDSLITPVNADSVIGIYTGLTPNGDTKNDVWFISGIDTLPDNTVTIFNRWGELTWRGDHYDNNNIVFAGKNTMGEEVVPGTYYYVIDVVGKKKKRQFKGWIELSR